MFRLFIFTLVALTHTTSAMRLSPKPFSSQHSTALAERLERAPPRQTLRVFPIPLMASNLRKINSLANEFVDSAHTLHQSYMHVSNLMHVLEHLKTTLAESEETDVCREICSNINWELYRIYSELDEINLTANHLFALLHSLQRSIRPFNIDTSIIDINTNIDIACSLSNSARNLSESLRTIIINSRVSCDSALMELNSPAFKDPLNNIGYYGGILTRFAQTLPELVRPTFQIDPVDPQLEVANSNFGTCNPTVIVEALDRLSRLSTSERLATNHPTN
jgi:hypothetical protein